MKSNTIFISIIVILLFLNIILISRFNTRNSQVYDVKPDQLTDSYFELQDLKKFILFQQQVEGTECENFKIKSIKDQTELTIDQLMKNYQNVLCFRFKETDCDACISRIQRILTSGSKRFPQKSIIILSGYRNVRHFYAYAQTINSSIDVYNVDSLPISLDNKSMPFFFVLTREKKVQNVFLPNEKDPDLTIRYMDIIREKYWSTGERNIE